MRFLKGEFCKNWNFQYVNFRIKCGFCPSVMTQNHKSKQFVRRGLSGLKRIGPIPFFFRGQALSQSAFLDCLQNSMLENNVVLQSPNSHFRHELEQFLKLNVSEKSNHDKICEIAKLGFSHFHYFCERSEHNDYFCEKIQFWNFWNTL